MKKYSNMEKISRIWSMPNSQTFKIKAIKELIQKYVQETDIVLDPFANTCTIRNEIKCRRYISNDLDMEYNTNYHLDAQYFLKLFGDNSIDIVLYDPPYSPRQVKECYQKLNKTVTIEDTKSSYFSNIKKEISRVLKPGGICISCGWNSNGIGKTYGFEIVEILMVAHGSSHNDTICVVERKKEQRNE